MLKSSHPLSGKALITLLKAEVPVNARNMPNTCCIALLRVVDPSRAVPAVSPPLKDLWKLVLEGLEPSQQGWESMSSIFSQDPFVLQGASVSKCTQGQVTSINALIKKLA